MKKFAIVFGLILMVMMCCFFNSTNLFADQVYAEKKVITQQVVPGINTSVEVTIVECIGVGATPCTASTTTKHLRIRIRILILNIY